MPIVKTVKNKSYYKRFQVKYRRRREGKTDYRARKRLVTQEKNKYNSPKYRFVARFTNKDVVCQVIYAKISGDHVLASAYSHELKTFGLPVGLTNYAAAYATGLLCARRLLTSKGIADQFQGETTPTGKMGNVGTSTVGRRPFKALLDVGLARTTTGAKVFACMKGAVDGGVFIPHNEKRFVGFKEGEDFKPELLRGRIFGAHVAAHMKLLEKDKDAYNRQFSQYAKAGITAQKIESTLKATFAAIRKNPMRPKKDGKPAPKEHHKGQQRLNRKQRLGRSNQKLSYIVYKKAQIAEAASAAAAAE